MTTLFSKMKFYYLLALSLLIYVINANPQGPVELNDRIQDIFGLSDQIYTDNRAGFADIVTPEPENIPPTLTPQVINNNGQSCKCVPYWKCAPENGPMKTTDSRFFGEIDVR